MANGQCEQGHWNEQGSLLCDDVVLKLSFINYYKY